MNSFDDWKQVVRRNKLVGMWAAEPEKLKAGSTPPSYARASRLGTKRVIRSPQRQSHTFKISHTICEGDFARAWPTNVGPYPWPLVR